MNNIGAMLSLAGNGAAAAGVLGMRDVAAMTSASGKGWGANRRAGTDVGGKLGRSTASPSNPPAGPRAVNFAGVGLGGGASQRARSSPRGGIRQTQATPPRGGVLDTSVGMSGAPTSSMESESGFGTGGGYISSPSRSDAGGLLSPDAPRNPGSRVSTVSDMFSPADIPGPKYNNNNNNNNNSSSSNNNKNSSAAPFSPGLSLSPSR